MKIDEIITILENKITDLYTLKNLAIINGNLEAVIRIETKINETEESLFILKNK
jgi:hypothetical protein